MANERPPQSTGMRVLGIILFVVSFIAAYFLVRYLMGK
jgi:hypothetical protein